MPSYKKTLYDICTDIGKDEIFHDEDGNIFGCPEDYFLKAKACNSSSDCSCEECWNNEYQGEIVYVQPFSEGCIPPEQHGQVVS